MNQESQQFKKRFLIKWIFVTWIAFIVGFGVFFAAGYGIEKYFPELVNITFGLGIGATVGYSQWLVLRKQFPVNSFWGTAYLIGMGIPFIVAAILWVLGIEDAGLDHANSPFAPYIFVTLFTVGGLLVGFLQLHLLKPFSTKAGWWLAATSISWGVASSLIFLIPVPMDGRNHFPVALLSSGILIGVITGLGLLWITKTKAHSE